MVIVFFKYDNDEGWECGGVYKNIVDDYVNNNLVGEYIMFFVVRGFVYDFGIGSFMIEIESGEGWSDYVDLENFEGSDGEDGNVGFVKEGEIVN